GAIRDMSLAISAQDLATGINDRDRIEITLPRMLEEAHRQHHIEFARQLRHALDRRIVGQRRGQPQVPRILLDAEIRFLEQLLQQDQLRTVTRRAAYQRFGPIDVRSAVPITGKLRRGHRDPARRTVEMLWLRRGPVGAHSGIMPPVSNALTGAWRRYRRL